MQLKQWIDNHYRLSQSPDWQKIFQEHTSEYFISSEVRLFQLLKECDSIEGIANQMPNFLPILISSGEPEVALTQLLEFSKSFLNKFKSDFYWNRVETKSLIQIFGRSNFISTRLIRNPEIAKELIDSPFLFKKKSLKKMESELKIRIDKKTKFSKKELKNILRRYKYEEYLRITVRDLAKLCPFKETLEELSNIAICSLRVALTQITLNELKFENFLISKSIPKNIKRCVPKLYYRKDEEFKIIYPFTIFGLGKLGGYELNYSSDIDLIFVHDNEKITGDREQDYKIRMKVARNLIDTMSDITEEGFLARMDMRLRPGGDRSPLIQSLDEMEIYYSTSREIWERQALIKAVKIVGNSQCEVNFFKMITPFVYRSLLDQAVLLDVEKVKNRIEKEHLRESF